MPRRNVRRGSAIFEMNIDQLLTSLTFRTLASIACTACATFPSRIYCSVGVDGGCDATAVTLSVRRIWNGVLLTIPTTSDCML